MNVGPGRQNFRYVGVIQQFSASLIRLSQLIDGGIMFATLYFTVYFLGDNWRLEYIVIALAYVLIFEVSTSFFHMYRSWRVVRLRYELAYLVVFWFLSSASVIFLIYAFNDSLGVQSRTVMIWLALSLLSVAITRIAMRITLRYARAFGYDTRNVAFVGATDIAVKLRGTFESHPWMGMSVVGVYDDRISGDDRGSARVELDPTGDTNDLNVLARDGSIDIVYICLPMAAEKRIGDLINAFSDTTVSISYCPSFLSFDLMNARWDDVFGQPVFSVAESPFSGYRGLLKRLEDLILICIFMPFVTLLMLPISIAVALTSPGPIFYKQSRCGLGGERFLMWKFRTMFASDRDQEFLQATKNDPRITPVGKFLRATSLDELPQFINVLRGDMSFIGPRPHPDVVNDDQRGEIHRYMMRHKVRPGITGLAQVSGFRGETDTPDKMEGRIACDLEYIRKWSLWLDIRILFRTVFVMRGADVY